MQRRSILLIAISLLVISSILIVSVYYSNSRLFDRVLYHVGFQEQICKPLEKSFDSNDMINFAVVGDIDVTENSLKTLKSIASFEPELILFAGDLIYNYGTAKEWFEFSDFLGKEKIKTAFGDADFHQKEDYMKHYEISNDFYSFNFENIHFIVLSTETPSPKNSEQTNFLLADLESSRNDPIVDWIIVLMHDPMYSSDASFTEFRNNIQPIFDLYDIDVVLNGNRHVYERTKPLVFNEVSTTDSPCSYSNPDGQIYITVGTGGHSHSPFKNKSVWSIVQNDNDFGFLNMQLANNGTVIYGEFIANSGKIIDAFQIYLRK